MKQFNVQVIPYLEFMNAILLTSRYNELTMPYIGYGLITDESNEYTTALKAFFKPYHDERIYRMIEDMISNGFTFSRPVELMLSLENSKNFEMRFPLSPLCIQYCGGLEQVQALLSTMQSFEKKVNFFEFFDSVKAFYDPIIERVSKSLLVYPFIDLIEEQFGSQQNSYNYVLSSLMKGNFGINFFDNQTSKADMFSVFATDDFSLSPGILFHEYSHPFVNPLTDKYYNSVQMYVDNYEKLKKYKLPDYQSGYGDFKEFINEHFVRAMAIHLLKKCQLNDMANQLLNNDLYCGYKYIPLILERYDFYDNNRNLYADFEEYYPELLSVFSCSIF